MKSKTLLCALSAVALLSSLPVLADPSGKRIALSVTSTRQPFVAALVSTMEKQSAALGMKLTAMTAGYDAAVQDQQINDAIAQRYDMLAVSAFDQHAIIPALTRAKNAGIPVILVNALIEPGHDDLALSFVGENKEELGIVAGKAVLEAVKGRKSGNVAVITGTLTDAVAQLQLKGFKSVVEQNPKLKIIATEDARWDMANAERIAGQLFARFGGNGQLDAVFTMVDSMAFGVIQAAKAADVPLGTAEGKVIVVSSGCMKFGLNPLRNGEMYSSINVTPTRIGNVAVQMIADHFNGKTLPKNNYLPVEEITKANVTTYAEACTY